MRSVTFVLALMAAGAAFADYPVSTPRIGPANGIQWLPSVAGNGHDYLAAWIDGRGSVFTPGYPASGPEPDVYATRIGANGVPAGDGGVPVARSLASDSSVVVVPHGDDYFVFQSMLGVVGIPPGLAMTRVTSSGPAESRIFVMDLGSGDEAPIGAAWNGSVFLIVVSSSSSTALTAVIIDDSFNVVVPAFPLSSSRTGAAVASDGRDFVVTWIDTAVRAAVVTASGNMQANPQTLAPAPSAFGTAIAWTGDRYVVAWSDGAVHTRELGRDAVPVSIDVTLAASGKTPAVAWNGTTAGVAFAGDGVVDLVIFAAPLRTIAIAPGDQPSVASAGGGFLVAYRQDGDVHSKLVEGPDAVLALSLSDQHAPCGVFDGANFGFAWQEASQIRFGRSTLSGQPLDGDGIDLGAGSVLGAQVAFAGDEYLVAWSDFSTYAVHVARISGDGRLLDASLTLPVALQGFAVATDGRDFLILTAEEKSVFATIVTHEGAVMRRSAVATLAAGIVDLQAVWSGSRYVTAFVQYAGNTFNHSVVPYAALLDRTGAVAVAPFVLDAYGVLASGRGSALSVSIDAAGIATRTIDENGGVSAPVRVAGPCNCAEVDVAWNGSDYFIAFDRTVMRIGGTAPIGVPDAAFYPMTLAGGPGAVAIVYPRMLPLHADGPVGIVRLFWELVPPPHTIRRLWRS